MYWGEGEVHLATSQNLIDWEPLEDAAGGIPRSCWREESFASTVNSPKLVPLRF